GNGEMVEPDRWQPMSFDVFIGQSGIASGNTPEFVGPEWGWVKPFALTESTLTLKNRGGYNWPVYYDPGDPAYLRNSADAGDAFRWNFSLVSVWGSHLDPTDGVMWDISPASIGNVKELPANPDAWRDFYDLVNGGDPGQGHDLNPHTGEPYAPQIVPRADYARVLAEFWADGPDSETPPGHWYVILNEVNEHPELKRRFEGQGPELDPLEWDVKCYLALGGAMHDAAIAAWGIKGYYDYLRPISAIRYMAGKGQSSDPNLINYDPEGLPIIPGFIEQIQAGDDLEGFNGNNIGRMKVRSWRGPDFIFDPTISVAGVGWILAEYWWPYQRPTFVSPPFAGYVSGHSTYSRAAAEVLTMMTGDPFFPGGMGEFPVKQDSFLVFERGPSVPMTLQWATYRDASDQTSLSRIWGGIHPPVDDIPGRLIGEQIGIEAFARAKAYFEGEIETTSLENLPLAFPNPVQQGASWMVYIPVGTPPGNLQLIDLAGRLCWEQAYDPGNIGTSLSIPTVRLNRGMYILVVQHEAGKQHIKLQLR
ncbi:MAG: T9SS type A sorting domain-containing protein, partial [Bacteroidota bacterium]